MAIEKIVLKALDSEVSAYAESMKRIVKEEAHVKTGALRDSISIEKKGECEYLVGVDAGKLKSDPRNIGGIDYSVPYHDGHRAYKIVAKKAKALRWVGKDGRVHYAKSVQIPASTGDPFIERAVKRRPRLGG